MSDINEDQLTYVEALNELRALVENLASEQDIDKLAKDVSRAKVLIEFCRGRIASAELEINQILNDDTDMDPF